MENQTAYEEARAFCDKCHRDFLRRLKQREESAMGPDGQKGRAEMNMESIVQRCTETFSKKLRAALEEVERQGAESVEVEVEMEIKIHVVDEPLSEESTEATEAAEDARGRMEAALLEYIERLAAGDTYLDEGQAHHLVDAAELLDKLLSRREK